VLVILAGAIHPTSERVILPGAIHPTSERVILPGAIHPTSERVALTITSVGYERDGIDEIAQRANLKYTALKI
jgi:hypothetical protein